MSKRTLDWGSGISPAWGGWWPMFLGMHGDMDAHGCAGDGGGTRCAGSETRAFDPLRGPQAPALKPVEIAPSGRRAARLVVFSDDYGRHPSSCQHLVRELLGMDVSLGGADEVLWVNTVGTRTPGLSVADLSRGMGKLREWMGGAGGDAAGGAGWPGGLRVMNPKMWPGFRRGWQRRFNARSIARAVDGGLGERVAGEERIAITTLPITADLVGRVDVDRWVYYCVDDFSVWPGLDSAVMQTMERELVGKVDEVVAVSGTLQKRIAGMGKDAGLLTHGIDMEHWDVGAGGSDKPDWWPDVKGPIAVFWGLIDRRLEIDWCRALSVELGKRGGSLVLAGPQQDADVAIHGLADTVLPGAVAYEELPGLAGAADVLVMPYIDAAVTRAMQPLKFKEYLATGRPVVVRELPATSGWGDCCDVVGDEGEFVRVCLERAEGGGPGVPVEQGRARERRLGGESWSEKARQFAEVWNGAKNPPMRSAA